MFVKMVKSLNNLFIECLEHKTSMIEWFKKKKPNMCISTRVCFISFLASKVGHEHISDKVINI